MSIHYYQWKNPPKRIGKLTLNILQNIITEGFKEKIIQKDWNEFKAPICNSNQIKFNGVYKEGYDCLRISLTEIKQRATIPDDNYIFSCNTNHQYYDEYVRAVLWTLKEQYKYNFIVKSTDSFKSEEWDFAKKLYEDTRAEIIK